MEKANRVTTTEVFRTFYTPAANAVVMIKPVLSADGQVAITAPALSGIETGTKDTAEIRIPLKTSWSSLIIPRTWSAFARCSGD